MGAAGWIEAKSIIGEFEAHDVTRKVLIMSFMVGVIELRDGFLFILARIEVGGGNIISICLGCRKAAHFSSVCLGSQFNLTASK